MAADPATSTTTEHRLKQLGLLNGDTDWTERYLLCDQLVDPSMARPRQQFEAVARFVRDMLAHRWVKT
jgi:starch phosphorylase